MLMITLIWILLIRLANSILKKKRTRIRFKKQKPKRKSSVRSSLLAFAFQRLRFRYWKLRKIMKKTCSMSSSRS